MWRVDASRHPIANRRDGFAGRTTRAPGRPITERSVAFVLVEMKFDARVRLTRSCRRSRLLTVATQQSVEFGRDDLVDVALVSADHEIDHAVRPQDNQTWITRRLESLADDIARVDRGMILGRTARP